MFGRRHRQQLEGHEQSRATAVKFMEALLAPTAGAAAVTRDALTRAAAARQARHVLSR
jgi:hypothetical protein